MIQFAIRLVRLGLLTPEQFIEALEREVESRKRLGQLALESRKLSLGQVLSILQRQAEAQQPFGRIATEMGLLTEKDLAKLLYLQSQGALSLMEVLREMAVISPDRLDAELGKFYSENVENRETAAVKLVLS